MFDTYKSPCDVADKDYIDSHINEDTGDLKSRDFEKKQGHPISITDAAFKRIEEILLSANLKLETKSKIEGLDSDDKCNKEKENRFIGLRLGVKAGGCVGFKYAFECVKEKISGDIDIMLANDVRLFVPPGSMLYIIGTMLDYKINHEDFSEGFIFINPNAKGSCGCGESFYV